MSSMSAGKAIDLAAEIGARFGQLANVRAVALAGSHTSPFSDAMSDIDLYVYADSPVDLSFRRELAKAHGCVFELDNTAFEPSDEWQDETTGIWVDVIYRDPAWIEGNLRDLLEKFQAGIGYSTCFWDNVLTSVPLFDRDDWFAELQKRARQPYPVALAEAIIDRNLPLLKTAVSSFGNQIHKAALRGDQVAVHHRATAFLASYFDVLFAINRTPHPGEKRLANHAALLPHLPTNWHRDVEDLLRLTTTGTASEAAAVVSRLTEALTALRGSDPSGVAKSAVPAERSIVAP